MEFINLSISCPICGGALGSRPFPHKDGWIIQCWNHKCCSWFKIIGTEVRAIEVQKLERVGGLDPETGKIKTE